jgi:IS5 family transposase
MDAVVRWKRLYDLTVPFHPKPDKGRRPVGADRMLRIYFLQHWFDLSDRGVEEALYGSEVMRRFADIELGHDTT